MNLPSNPAYLSMSTMLFGLYGLLLFMIYKNPKESRGMIIYASLVKLGFIAIVIYYLLSEPLLVDMPFRILAVIDLVFGVLFLESLKFAGKR